jgi:hypothetical protein
MVHLVVVVQETWHMETQLGRVIGVVLVTVPMVQQCALEVEEVELAELEQPLLVRALLLQEVLVYLTASRGRR